MKLIVSVILLSTLPIVFINKPKQVYQPKVDRLSQARRVQEIRDFCKPDYFLKSEGRMPVPKVYSGWEEPDSGSCR